MKSRLSPVSKIQACQLYRKFHYEPTTAHIEVRMLYYRSVQNNLQIFTCCKSAMHLGIAPRIVAEPVRAILVAQQLNCNWIALCNQTVKQCYAYHFLSSKRRAFCARLLSLLTF